MNLEIVSTSFTRLTAFKNTCFGLFYFVLKAALASIPLYF